VADTGRVATVRPGGGLGQAYLVDNGKLGLYGKNELASNGYWLHLAGPYNGWQDPLDSSLLGGAWRIDSNTVDTNNTGQYEFRIHFHPGTFAMYPISSVSVANYDIANLNKQYQILSAPIFRSAYDSTEVTQARVTSGGRFLQMATGTVQPHEFDHIPHYVELLEDTLHQAIDTALVRCKRNPVSGVYECDTIFSDQGGNRWRPSDKVIAGVGQIFPIRTSYVDTNTTPDSLIIWTQGKGSENISFSTTKWRIWRACIPYASDGEMFLDRLYLAGDPTTPNTICFSDKGIRGAQLGAFPAANIIQLPTNGDAFTGFAKIYDWLVIFQREHTYLLKGDPFTNTEIVLALPDEGCIAINSIVELDNQIIYLSHKGWRIFDGNSSQDFAQAIKPAVQGHPRELHKVNQAYKHLAAAAFDPNTGNIWMSMAFGTDTVNSGSFIFNSVANAFSFTDEIYGGDIEAGTFLDTTRLVFSHPGGAADTANRLFNYAFVDSTEIMGVDGDSIDMEYTTGWMDFGAPMQKKFVSDGSIIVKLAAPVGVGAFRKFVVTLYKDFDTTGFYSETVNVFSLISSVHYEDYQAVRLQPNTAFEFLKAEIKGFGLSAMEIQRLSFRWNLGADAVRTRTTLRRP